VLLQIQPEHRSLLGCGRRTAIAANRGVLGKLPLVSDGNQPATHFDQSSFGQITQAVRE
jgi:hypothetical protein